MAVVSRDNHERLIKNSHLLQLLDSSANSVVKLQKITQRTIIVEAVHGLVNRRSLRHEEEAFVTASLVQDIDSLERHVLEAGEVQCRRVPAEGIVLEILEVVLVDVSIQPHGEILLAKDTEGPLVVGGLEERRLVQADRVSLLGKLGVVVLALVGVFTCKEVLCTASKEDVGPVSLCPAVVGESVERLVDQGTVLATEASVACQGDRSGIG